jgi:hypothetical protein
MDTRSMHYDVKQKLNKIDSQQYRNLRVPEIDWNLNEGIDIFIKAIAEPRINNHLGFEINQRSIDDIRTIVINDFELTPTQISGTNTYFAELPQNYMFFVSAEVEIKKDGCEGRLATCRVRQHDDLHEQSPFDNSSFEWREVNIRFYERGIKIFTDGTFEVTKLKLNYIRKHVYIHNAQDFLPTQSYTLPDGTVLTGEVNCELPEHTHREIVDITVLIMSHNLSLPDLQAKVNKTNLNQII